MLCGESAAKGFPEPMAFASSAFLKEMLSDVWPDGRAMNVTEGIARARYRLGFDRQELLQPGEAAEYRIRLYDTAMVFKRGHRLRLDVSSSSFPRRGPESPMRAW